MYKTQAECKDKWGDSICGLCGEYWDECSCETDTSGINAIFQLIRNLKDEDRKKLWYKFRGVFCMDCGKLGRCHCMNDE